MNTNKFNDGSSSAYAELPVPAAYLKWTRGNAQLKAIAKGDPGAYFGGWRAFTLDKDGNPLPTLPLPIAERVSDDGKHPYKVYASNFVSFLPIRVRTRFELHMKVKDEQTGREYERVVSVSKEKRQGYAPNRQVFGWVFDPKTDEHAPGVLMVAKWSTFISFEKSGQAWNKIAVPEGKALIRRYGTLGKKEGEVSTPNFEIYGQGRSTPIEPIGLSKPRFITITPEMEELLEKAQVWQNCERWNAEGKIAEEDTASDKSLFLSRCNDLALSNIDIEQLVKEANGDYGKALINLKGGEDADVNLKFSDAEEEVIPF